MLFAPMKDGAGKIIKLFVMVRGALKPALKNFGASVCCANPTLNTFYTINLRNCKITLEEETFGANTSIHFQLLHLFLFRLFRLVLHIQNYPHLYPLANLALLQIQTHLFQLANMVLQIQTVNKKNMQLPTSVANTAESPETLKVPLSIYLTEA